MVQERGAALLMALMLAVLVAVLAGGMMRDEQRRIRLLENQRMRDQADQMGEGALDWARLILRDDLRLTGPVDHNGEIWALPISDIPLSAALGGGDADVRLSGRIIDAQSRFNLMSLLKVDQAANDRVWVAARSIDPHGLAAFQRLLSALGLDPAQGLVIAQAMLDSRFDARPTDQTTLQMNRVSKTIPLPFCDVAQLVMYFPDADAPTLQRLQAAVVLLPQPTTVNVNTASALLLGAMLGIDPAQLSGLMALRQKQFFVDQADVQRQITATLPNLPNPDLGLLGVGSQYFYVLEALQRPGADQRRQALVARHAGTGGAVTQVIEERRGWTVGDLNPTGGV